MDNLSDILSRKDFDIPPEAKAIKDYVRRHYASEVQVTVQQRSIIIKAQSGGLIATLRLNAPAIQAAANTQKRLTFRIG
jgi:phosphopantothenoylcysteine synthetase/decarboxylase